MSDIYSFRSYDIYEERGRSRVINKGRTGRGRKGSSSGLRNKIMKCVNSKKFCTYCFPKLGNRIDNQHSHKTNVNDKNEYEIL